ncbi:hypothetical protein P7K49_036518 [Saguinus oedipus]|uniref:Dynein light intermediate chain n=1 Tax=Saguinus oedipus TaxID=9490 RepID=A0ABQ9TKB5_SAGOE|nr:hypothetical protein P7K49_036518 [Saguinus oedipus]
MAPVGVEKKLLLGPNGPAVAAAGDLTSEEEEGQSLWSSILSEVSTRSRSKLPSGKNILVFGERRRRGVAPGRWGGLGGRPSHRSRPSPFQQPARILAGKAPSDLARQLESGQSPSPEASTVTKLRSWRGERVDEVRRRKWENEVTWDRSCGEMATEAFFEPHQ